MNIKKQIDAAAECLRTVASKDERTTLEERQAFALASIASSLLGIAMILNEVEGNGTLRVRDEGGQV